MTDRLSDQMIKTMTVQRSRKLDIAIDVVVYIDEYRYLESGVHSATTRSNDNDGQIQENITCNTHRQCAILGREAFFS